MPRSYLSLALGALLSLASVSALAQIYTWKDADGNTIYSDRPHPNAKTIELQPTNTVQPPANPQASQGNNASGNGNDDRQSSGRSYRDLQIASPANDEAIRSNEGTLSVTVNTDPPLSSGHLMRVVMDGELREEAVAGNGQATQTLNLNNIDRGSHTLAAVVYDARGNVVQSTAAITVHIQRTSVNQPGRTGSNQAPRPGNPNPGGGNSGGSGSN
ncbi:MAG: DUF4124 domain-containing protein [Pseudomonas sp.]|jgi:hypothetical protein|uniref:DUF4124 domain-containing protein n=1 Tax=Halopseudomonas TaxID=2901189 RepID=UPI001B76D2C4|nr:DUF4124 domain-containing protein [Pseudomonas sp.]MBQ0778260.1 DUF4124 domain-containing protein [Pseudomonas sp.]